jgi:4-hydroxybenzoate polyprenyltransferase
MAARPGPGALAVLHPFPSIVNAVLVAGLFTLAGGALPSALLLGIGMLGLQFAIGAVNDLADATDDAVAKPWKPIASGKATARAVRAVALVAAGVGLLVYASFGPLLLLMGVAMLGIGLAYDLGLKRAGFGWLCYAAAFPLLPLSTWLAAAGGLPPRPELLLPMAALAGPALQLSNGLVDLESDRAAGIRSPAVRLGPTRTVLLLGVLVAVVYGIAAVSLLAGGASVPALLVIGAAAACATCGVGLSASRSAAPRERGWQLQAVAIALLAAGWVAAVR